MNNRTIVNIAVATVWGAVSFLNTAKAQNSFNIGPGMQVLSGTLQVTIGGGTFVNNGSYTDTTGTFNIRGGVVVSGSGTTTLNNLKLNYASGISVFNSLVSVNKTTELVSGSLNANNNLFVRSDYSPTANIVVTGVLTGDVQGLVTRATTTVGACPAYTSTLSSNISGAAIRFQWQSSADGISWFDVVGATNAVYVPTVSGNIFYRCDIRTTNSSYHQATPSVNLQLTGVPDMVTVTGSGPYCVQATILASGGSGGTIYYQGTTSGGTSVSTPGDSAQVAATGTYYFRSRSAAGCWGKQDSAYVVINPLVTPAVSLNNSAGLHVCGGATSGFTALPVNGGPTPFYTWTVNGVPTAVSGSSFSYVPSDGDVVKVVLTSSAPCPVTPTVSALATMEVDSNYVPVAQILASPSTFIKEGDLLTLTTVVTGAGPAPAYQWIKNGMAIDGATTSVYKSNKFADKDSVSCMVVGSGICAWPTFNSIVISVSSTGVSNMASGGHIGIMPNPSNGSFVVKGALSGMNADVATLEVTNMLGQTMYKKEEKVMQGGIDAKVELGPVARGSYVLSVTVAGERAAFHIVVDR